MRYRLFLGLGCAIGLAAGEAQLFFRPLSSDQKIVHALNRLTFGPRPGDVDRVRVMGLKKWIDLQLHPERIPENPELTKRLAVLDSLSMSPEELVRNYPTPQMVRQMVAGRIPFPTDPERRRMLERLVARVEQKQGGDNASNVLEMTPIADLLTPQEIRSLRTGTPQQRMEAFQALPPSKQDAVIAALPAGIRQVLFTGAPPEIRRKIELTAGPQQVLVRDLQEGKILRAIYSSRQLEEVLTDFWYNHFNVYLDKGADRYLVTAYERDVIRPHVLGKFRDLLEATAKSPAMLFYLDNWRSAANNSPRGGLNENYGRELMELHTLGVDGGYTQKDVTEVARCFTGWTIRQPQLGGEFTFNKRMHDAGEKVVLGVRIPAGGGIEDGEKVLDILARHPSTAHFISKKLAQRFVADNPPESLVNRMARTFLKTDGDLRAVMKTMLDSKEFWSQGAYGNKMKSPLELVASAVRAVNGDVDFAFPLANQVAQLGEPLYRKVEPTGYSNSSREWLNTAGLLARMNFAVQLSSGKIPGVKVSPSEGQNGTELTASLGSPEFQKH
jgi:uncharacterized protein (DUF1800 family)